MEDWAEIRRLHLAEAVAIREIVRRLGVSRNAVRRALAAEGPPKYSRSPRGSAVDAFEPAIRALLEVTPSMPATVLAERVGWDRSMTVFKERVRELRPLFAPLDPASRTTYQPGELVQCDLWFPPVDVPVGAGQVGRAPVLVMVSGYSRWLSALMLPSRKGPDLISGHWQLLQAFGAVPRSLVWDNESAVGSWRGGKPRLTDAFAGFAGTLGAGVIQCRPRDPEAKGLVERANGYLETSFLPGRVFISPQDFNAQLGQWLALANARRKRSLGCAPSDRVDADREVMLGLPPVAPLTGWRTAVRLPRDHYVRVAGNDYSVNPAVIGRLVEVVAGLDTVTMTCAGGVVAVHERCWARHQTLTDPAHRAAAAQLRQAHASGRPQTGQAGSSIEVAARPLSDYDAVFGTGTGHPQAAAEQERVA